MAVWTEDWSGRSMEEVKNSESENRVWNKELRLKARALVNSRLAKDIGADEYAATRRFANEDAAECARRGILLVNEIRSREGLGK